MNKSFWDRLQDLHKSITGDVEPMASITLPTKVIKTALGLYLIQSGIIGLWWAVDNHAFYPILIFLSAFVQVGWFWSKVTDSWKTTRYTSLFTDEESYENPINPPTINVDSVGGLV